MTQEEKSLLIKDLCARLPYGVQVQDTRCGISGKLHDMLVFPLYKGNNTYDYIATTNFYTDCYYDDIALFKPYLFPLSSMTEEQRLEIEILTDGTIGIDQYSLWDFTGYSELSLNTTLELIQWLYENHFDIYGLIPMGLANDATGLNIY